MATGSSYCPRVGTGISHLNTIFYDASCKVIFDMEECRVYHNSELVLTGGKDQGTGPWKIPVNPILKPTHITSIIANIDLHMLPNQSMNHLGGNMDILPYK